VEKQDTKISIKSEKKFGLKEGQLILCKNCKNIITAPEHNITVNGQYIHKFTNPEGITYQITCFSSANGCIVHGTPTLDYTWFEGFSWSYSLCSNCFTHLGWYYQCKDKSFFGLILDRLSDNTNNTFLI
jgi:hypothetical protein